MELTDPWLIAVLIMTEPDERLGMVRDVGFAEMVNFRGRAVTVRERLVVETVPSEPVPVIVTLYVPAETVEVDVKLMLVAPEGPMLFGVNVAETPVGTPEAVKEMVLLEP